MDFACVITGDSKRKGLGFLCDQPDPTLDPAKKLPKHLRKNCPSCGEIVHELTEICPHCGHEFDDVEESGGNGNGDSEEDVFDDVFEEEFGELFDKVTKEKVDYLRSQARTRFSKNQPRDRLWELFYKRYGHYPNNDWLYGALFGRERTSYNRDRLLDYLYKTSPRQPPKKDWLRFHFRLEFGDRALEKEEDIPATRWWEILQLNPDDDWNWQMVKSQYGTIAKTVHPDHGGTDEQMQRLNWALNKAKRVCKS